MPRQKKPPRLFYRKRENRWVILDSGTETSTGCSFNDRAGAEKALADYLVGKHEPSFGSGRLTEALIPDILTLFLRNCVEPRKDGERVKLWRSRVTRCACGAMALLRYWGNKTANDITEETCREYKWLRTSGIAPFERPAKNSTTSLELNFLQAAVTYAFHKKKINVPVKVWRDTIQRKPERFLTRSEAARLILAARGWRVVLCDIKTRKPLKMMRWPRDENDHNPIPVHVSRFIVFALYTGTRHEAALRMRWQESADPESGWIDFDNAILHRRGEAERESSKRRVPARIGRKLMGHLRRWHKLTKLGPMEYRGRLIERVRHGFEEARVAAEIRDKVTPHVLKHTYITWALQKGVDIREVAAFTGTSEETIRRYYEHHSPDFMVQAANAF